MRLSQMDGLLFVNGSTIDDIFLVKVVRDVRQENLPPVTVLREVYGI